MKRKHLSDHYGHTHSWVDGTTINVNDYNEVEGMTEITSLVPVHSSFDRNKEQRQEFADKNNNGELGHAYRYHNTLRDTEAWVDPACKVFWKCNFR